MPIDKQPKPSTTTKPVTPALSSHFRTPKPGPRPRLPGSAATSPAVTTRKDIRAQTLSPGNNVQTPTLSLNITPRSGSRSSRIGTESPVTPVSAQRPLSNGPSQLGYVTTSPGSAIARPHRSIQSNSTQTISRRSSGSSTILRKDEQPTKLMRAAEARPALVSSRSMANIRPKSKTVGFVRTATTPLPPDVLPSPESVPGVRTDEENRGFFRANDAPSNPTTCPARPLLSTKLSSASAPVATSRTPESIRGGSTVGSQMSPKKNGPLGLYKPVSPPRGLTMQHSFVTLPDNSSNRRASIGSSSTISRQSQTQGHKKSASVSTAIQGRAVATPPVAEIRTLEPAWVPSSMMNFPPSPTPYILASPDTLSPRSASLASSKTAATSVTSDTDLSEISKIALTPSDLPLSITNDAPQAGTKPAPQSQTQINAGNARRERKVLDLEISNSSLLAINKTLERELKKQSTELRRFRRLSRTGRLSVAPTDRSVSSQSFLSTLSEHSDEEDQDGNSSDADEVSDSEPSTLDEGDTSVLSNDSFAARTRQRARDERRLMLDLSKHQQLLIDSQKMSHSIRKCLNFTEELIKEGKRALDYKVGIGDVKLGGRVLGVDDHEEDIDAETHKGLLSPSLAMTELREATSWLGGLHRSETTSRSDLDISEHPPRLINVPLEYLVL